MPVDQQLYGMRVRASRPIPFAPAAAGDAPPDVVVTFGPFDEPLPHHIPVAYPDGTRFAVAADDIRCTWSADLTFEDACTYLVGPIFAFVLRMRGLVCLHASAIELGGAAIAISGTSGAGKSTLAAAFLQAGATLVAEDVVALTEREEAIVAVPSYAGVRLWPASVELLYGAPDAMPRITPTWEKRIVEPGPRFASAPLPVGALYFLDFDREQPSALLPLAPLETAMRLVANSYHSEHLDASARRRELELYADLAQQVPARSLLVGHDGTPHALRELIEADIACTTSSATAR